MEVTGATLNTLYTGFHANFRAGMDKAESQWGRAAMRVPSGTRTTEYGWLGQFPRFREWLGDRVIHGLQRHGFSITNKPWELTVSVNRDDIEDDNLGIYAPMFENMGMSTMSFPDEQLFPMLNAGFADTYGLAYDGQYFFDTDHPVLDENGVLTSVANTDGGSGTPWFLMDARSMLKPLIFQDRRAFQFVRLDKVDDENVFMRREFIYGVDGRANFGYGVWQTIWGSKQTLDATNYETARESLMAMKGDYGRPLGNKPNLLIVPPSLEKEGLELVNAERLSSGATNVYRGTAELVVVPWLA